MASARDWWSFLFGDGQPPAMYDRADAWLQVTGVGCGVIVVLGAAALAYVALR